MKKYRFPDSNSTNSEEKSLGKSLDYYIHNDEDFLKILKEKFNFKFRNEKKLEKQNAIAAFVEKNGYLPNSGNSDCAEKALALAVQLYICKGSSSFDKDFAYKHRNTLTYAEYKTKQIQYEIDNFVAEFGHLPIGSSKDLKEKRLSQAWSAFSDKNNNSFNEVFSKKHENTLTYSEWKNIETAKACIAFYAEHGVPPTKSSRDKIERKLGSFISGIKQGRMPSLDNTLKQAILNMKNVHEIKRDKTGLPKGVSKSNGKFQAHISWNNKLKHLGTFNTIEEAQAAIIAWIEAHAYEEV